MKVTTHDLGKLREDLYDIERAYLTERGWVCSCNHVDSCWRWEKDVEWRRGTEVTKMKKHYCMSLSDAVALQESLDSWGVDGICCACGYNNQEETPCPARDDGIHCEHWWDGESDGKG